MSFLSIIIPCYNVEAYLPQTIHSLSQLRNADDCEFIFVNDGSEDSTMSIIENFTHNDKRAILINQPNQGVAAARNTALDIAHGNYVLCLDGDDYLHPDTIEIIKENLKDADVLIAPCIISDKNETIQQAISIPNGQYTIEQLYKSCRIFPTAPQLIYKNSIIQQSNLRFNPAIKAGEVYDFTVSFFEHAKIVSVINHGFYYYVMRNTSATHLPNYVADLSVLNIIDHFNNIHQTWATSPSFLLTEFKIITAFTYNKYLRHKLTNSNTIQTIKTVLSNGRFRNLLTILGHKNIGITHKLHVYYLKYMPISLGYLIGVYVMRLFKH